MAKRARDESSDTESTAKRAKPSSVDYLSRLSDELILRVLSSLPISQLVVCQRLSHKYRRLAGDGQIWKAHYYNRFVRPRASRLPNLQDSDTAVGSLDFASRASRWLDDEYLVGRGARTNWKRQYKLRHNWSKGSAAVDEIEVAVQAEVPPVLVQMNDGVIYMADKVNGLRAWSAKGDRTIIAHTPFSNKSNVGPPPTSLAVDASDVSGNRRKTMIGFEDGSFSLYSLDLVESRFLHHYTHEPSTNGVISAAALSWPYATTMTATQKLSLYRFQSNTQSDERSELVEVPRLLHSLRSHTVWPPLSTSLRATASCVTISVAYALPTYLSGWTVGLQEIKVSLSGNLLDSRLASAIDQHYRPLAFATPPMVNHIGSASTGSLATSTTLELRHIHSKPISLSYTHPYLLVSHPDNTLTLYLVTSNADTLAISDGSRLWGHTSSVSGAHVGGRGKAVSVSRRGDELRVWELEGGFTSSSARKRLASGGLSVQVRPQNRAPSQQHRLELVNQAMAGRGPAACAAESRDDYSDLTLARGWIGFDDENVVVLKEQGQGRQALVVYDFT